MSSTGPDGHDSHPIITTEKPPTRPWGILRRLGPGLIIAGSIVGSGELIGTTATGAQAGYWLLWLIVLGCVIKVFAQVEFGRYAISTGKSAMEGLNETPGPRFGVGAVRGNWLLWYWLLMFFVSLGQLGGIVGGVGQALAISIPLTDAGRQYNTVAAEKTRLVFELQQLKSQRDADSSLAERIAEIDERVQELTAQLKGVDNQPGLEKKAIDHYVWATIITVLTAILLVAGRYGLIQWASAFMVASFTFVTVIDVLLLQSKPEWAVRWQDIVNGLSFRAWGPEQSQNWSAGLVTALSTFGIIGVGANELISYPYWCLEKGYARFTGPLDASPEWAERANGWLRVLRWDAWCSMLVYTFATIAFYLLGAAILGRFQLVPSGTDMIRTLSMMYEPVFGAWTQPLFLFGAFAVLYSTFFVANAGHARVCTDALRVFGLNHSPATGSLLIRVFSGVFPFLCLVCYFVYSEPRALVLASGAMQALMLPMLVAAAIYFRYRRIDPRIRPTKLWDLCLWFSFFVMLTTGLALLWVKLMS